MEPLLAHRAVFPGEVPWLPFLAQHAPGCPNIACPPCRFEGGNFISVEQPGPDPLHVIIQSSSPLWVFTARPAQVHQQYDQVHEEAETKQARLNRLREEIRTADQQHFNKGPGRFFRMARKGLQDGVVEFLAWP